MPTESQGYADALTGAPNGTPAAPALEVLYEPEGSLSESVDFSWISEALTDDEIPRSPIMHNAIL